MSVVNAKNKIELGSRLVLGLIFTVFGLNGFLNFLPMPPMDGVPAELMGAFAKTGYFFPLLKGTEVLAGLMLLGGFQVPLALLFLAPVVVNIFLFHWVLTGPSTVGMAVVIIALMITLAVQHWASFKPLFVKASNA